jgi:hypothetical protein
LFWGLNVNGIEITGITIASCERGIYFQVTNTNLPNDLSKFYEREEGIKT